LTVAFLAALALHLAVRWWLATRQIRFVDAHRDRVPEPFAARVPLAAHDKAADYTIARVRLGRLALGARALLLLGWTLGGGIEALDRAVHGVAFLLAAVIINEALLLPFEVYATFGIEQRFGFNRTTPRLFVADLARGLALLLVLGGGVAAAMLWLMDTAPRNWFAWAWFGYVALSLLLAWAVPAFVAPLFNRFTPLADKELERRIRALLERTGFTYDGVFVMDGSRRSSHANAYFTGWGSKKRIVLYDTLCAMLEPDEIEAVLAHELGHFRLRHLWIRLGTSWIYAIAGLVALDLLLRFPAAFAALGVPGPSNEAALLAFLWVAPIVTFFGRPFGAMESRRHEFQADAFAAQHADVDALSRALVKLYEKNASTLTPDPLYAAVHASHPSVGQRVARLQASLG